MDLHSSFAAKPRPNILHILADDMGWNALSCYGNKDLGTPNLDSRDALHLRLCGRSMLTQTRPIQRSALFWHISTYTTNYGRTPCAVIREGDWKLVEHFGDSFDENLHYQPGRKLELFNLREDLSESQNLAITEKVRAEAMSAKLHTWLESIPTPIPAENPRFDPKRRFEETKTKQAWNPCPQNASIFSQTAPSESFARPEANWRL